MTTQPDRWLILKICGAPDGGYRVFGMWIGGYLGGDSWRMNSGITCVEETERSFLFHGLSGSIYECRKRDYGCTAYGSSIVGPLVNEGRVEILPEDTDWANLILDENTH